VCHSLYFSPTNLMAFSFLLYASKLDREATMEFWDIPLIQLPGWCIPVHGTDLGEAYQDRKSEAYKMAMHLSKQILAADGILCNSFSDIETELTSLMKEGDLRRPLVYTIGPLVRSIPDQQVNVSDCMQWLDHQPSGSVLFVSFGSEGTL
jgi:hydroquinone glucosyltransferase